MSDQYNLIHKKVDNLDIYINPNLHKMKKKKKETTKRKSFYLRQMVPFPITLKTHFIETILFSNTEGKILTTRYRTHHQY
jgi:hypothetical protein